MTATAPLGVAVADTSVLLAAFNRKDDLHQQGADALSLARVLIVSPMVMTELDHLLARRAGEAEAINAVTRLGALAGQGFVVLPPTDGACTPTPKPCSASTKASPSAWPTPPTPSSPGASRSRPSSPSTTTTKTSSPRRRAARESTSTRARSTADAPPSRLSGPHGSVAVTPSDEPRCGRGTA
ncbi:PIN domain-containing protein [Kitasatospora sp. CMC57]|uniref:PIN domain-containing protein n=1 Tax=Kitasatospora sp. CMC57 TaxID=3231513 RepID=UPI0038B62C6F